MLTHVAYLPVGTIVHLGWHCAFVRMFFFFLQPLQKHFFHESVFMIFFLCCRFVGYCLHNVLSQRAFVFRGAIDVPTNSLLFTSALYKPRLHECSGPTNLTRGQNF